MGVSVRVNVFVGPGGVNVGMGVPQATVAMGTGVKALAVGVGPQTGRVLLVWRTC